MSFDLDDTIAAVASAPGGGLRSILRVSGPNTAACLGRVLRLPDGSSMRAIQAPACVQATITLGESLGDAPLILYLWPTARSYTRQPSAELHLPGSPPLLEAALATVCRAGARLAKPGEFTLRAFLAGRLDLTQAEAVLGVIDAGDETQLDAALAQLAGGLARPLSALREQLLDLLAHLEAGLDFAEEDIEFIAPIELARQLALAADAVQTLELQMRTRGEAGAAPHVVLVGLPNTGKSSLLNAMAGDTAAIVSELAGTTRDFVVRRLTLDGRECLLIDTAGLSGEHCGELDAAAQRMAREQAEQADLTLVCLDASRPLTAQEREQLSAAESAESLVVWTKCDLPSASGGASVLPAGVHTSSRTGAGIAELHCAIVQRLAANSADAAVVAGTADRCRDSLRQAGEALVRAQAVASHSGSEELAAAEIRLALEELGRVVGAIYTEDVLDRVFSRFCIGK
jgi:tRNA modification GTPase